MKKTLVFLLFAFTAPYGFSQPVEASLFDGLLNVASWVKNFDAVIEEIDNRETLKKLKRELSYLSTDINEITFNKKQLILKASNPNSEVSQYQNEINDLQESMRIFQERFRKINSIVPSEFKTEENPLTQNINELIWSKLETLEKVKSALYGDDVANWEISEELEKAVAVTEEISLQINELKSKIEEKLD